MGKGDIANIQESFLISIVEYVSTARYGMFNFYAPK